MPKPFFNELVNNAFEFLEKAIQQFKTEPKYSVINFCAAIELLLKARLMHEHWSLIISSKSHPNLNDFKSGNFKSINFNELIPRISSVTGEVIPPDIVECFNGLAHHRNKMIHFFHEAHVTSSQEKLLESIAIEQCSGWFFLRRLLEKWSSIFSKYEERIDAINYSMKEHEIYIDTVFKRIAPELKKAKENGKIFVKCARCKKEASEEFERTDYVFEYKCRVCLFQNDLLKIKCTEDKCKGIIKLESGDPSQATACPLCENEIAQDELEGLLDTSTSDPMDHLKVNCAACSGFGSVVEHENFWICLDCYFITPEMGVCGWCNEGQIAGGDLEYSFQGGCEFCDGHAGWTKDD